jgi:hypothetical protein
VSAAADVGGEKDPGVWPDETRELARLAGAACLIVPGADHLAAIKLANREVVELAVATFRRAEEAGSQEASREAKKGTQGT